MEVIENGRFCSQCAKKVFDFSGYSDAQLHQLFANKKDSICGRFLTTQVNRVIALPPQPPKKLYQIATALGFSLIFLQGCDSQSHRKTPLLTGSNNNLSGISDSDTKQTNVETDNFKIRFEYDTTYGAIIRGTARDSKGNALPGAIVKLLREYESVNDTMKQFNTDSVGPVDIKTKDSRREDTAIKCKSDAQGNYQFCGIAKGQYNIMFVDPVSSDIYEFVVNVNGKEILDFNNVKILDTVGYTIGAVGFPILETKRNNKKQR